MEKIILDCDPGHDDAIALVMAVLSPKIDLKAVTTSAGNQLPSRTLNNAMRILTLLGQKKIPVASGNRKPLMRELKTGVTMHGISGLDGADLPQPDFPIQTVPAIELIANVLRQESEPITIVVTGPCTNIALFLSIHPELKRSIKRLVVLGGGMGVGNWQPTTEFNMLVDPEAAKIVFDAGIPLVLLPLNVAYKAELREQDLKGIKALRTSVSDAVSSLLNFYGLQFNHGNRHFDGVPIYDPCTIAWLIAPEIFSGKRCNVEVETKGELTAGETIIDYYELTKREKNAYVLFDIDRERFAELVISTLKLFSQKG
ncbi:pyrimidine-specific ribonucleoside hydrolase RihA [Liquorilactobacillus uvarum]|uniref:pyrimidine-specific ribonucleoside hydrolase RihA n=1 Tax=Liquorilactobacillus uvarum TaxID=303240 RepID=UPI00288B32C5|nr:pyrimidine-specific ribonucleoside hydrolase RihA [Liquorilactobacillus uvarum]